MMNIDDEEKQIKQSNEKGKKNRDEHSKKKPPPSDDDHHKDSAKSSATAHSAQEKQTSQTSSTSTVTTVKKQRAVWKKPKDMPKRPLSAYNIFFQLHRTKIVEQGYITSTIEQPSTDEMVRSIEDILSTSREKKRPGGNTNNSATNNNKKSRGKIGFGNLARAIADSWKTLDPQIKSIYDHYAQFEMIRYKRELKVWKDKKEMENETRTIAKHADFVSRMNNSASGGVSSLLEGGRASYHGDLDTSQNLDFADERSINSEPWNLAFGSSVGRGGEGGSVRGEDVMNDDFNNSFSSLDSFNNNHASSLDFSYELESEPMRHLVNRQQQILQRLREESSPTNLPLQNQVPQAAGTATTSACAAFAPPQTMNMTMTMQRQHHQANMSSTQLGGGGGFGGGNQNYMQQQMVVLGMHPPQMAMQQFRHHQNPPQVVMGGFNHWNSSIGNASLNSLQSTSEKSMESSILNPSSNHGGGFSGGRQLYATNQVSDNSASQYSNSSISQSSSSGFNSSFSSSNRAAAGFQNRAAAASGGGDGSSSATGEDNSNRSPTRSTLFNREVEGSSGQPKR